MSAVLAPASAPLRALARDRLARPLDPLAAVETDAALRGAVAVALPGGGVRRAEPGPFGPVVLEAQPRRDGVDLVVHGAPATPRQAAEAALFALRGWVGADDDAAGFAELVAEHRLLRRLHREVGTPRLGRLPRLGEAVGRAVIAQLVQHREAKRSTAQLAALAGTPAEGTHALWCWPTSRQVGRVPTWELRRRCGLSLKAGTALHAAAVADARLEAAASDWTQLDRRLRALPGVGVWTSAETRRMLGDPDAVPVGDYNIPTLVGHVLGRHAGWTPDRPHGRWSDESMLALLEAFTPQRGRVIRLVGAAAARRIVPGPSRRAPRAALSAHRYW